MEELKSKAGDLADSVSEYVKTYYKYTILNTADKATGILASTVASLVILFLGIFVLLFAGLALGIWLGYLLDNMAVGYLLVAGLYLLVIIIVVALRKKIVFPLIRNKIVRNLYEQHD